MTKVPTRDLVYVLILLLLTLAAFAFLWAGSPPVSHAQELAYTVDDTVLAIDQVAGELGVSRTRLLRVVRCETGGTFDPYAIGRRGEQGAAQLASFGELPRFYAWGYDDPFSPYQAVRFLAQRLEQGSTAWSCK